MRTEVDTECDNLIGTISALNGIYLDQCFSVKAVICH